MALATWRGGVCVEARVGGEDGIVVFVVVIELIALIVVGVFGRGRGLDGEDGDGAATCLGGRVGLGEQLGEAAEGGEAGEVEGVGEGGVGTGTGGCAVHGCLLPMGRKVAFVRAQRAARRVMHRGDGRAKRWRGRG